MIMRPLFKKVIKFLFLFAVFSFVGGFVFFFGGRMKPSADVRWGVNFSYTHAENLGLDWKKTYLALLDDLGARRIKIITQWNLLEPAKDKFDFEAIDWQVKEAEKRNAKVFLVIGMKTPRYPECHIPGWAMSLTPVERHQEIKKLLTAAVEHYKNSPAIWAWQVENEPLFLFGKCPDIGEEFLREEVALVKSLDSRPVIVSETGEWSLWFQAAKIGDIVGTTLYRKVWFKELGIYTPYPFPAVFYGRRAWLVKKLFGKDVINVELQAEPWGPKLLYDLPPKEQEKTMNLERFKDVVSYAKRTGLSEFYFWGAEWWYWLKDVRHEGGIWKEARTLFKEEGTGV